MENALKTWWEYFKPTFEINWPLLIIVGIIAFLIIWMINLARHSKRLHVMGINTEAVVLSVKDHIANKNPNTPIKQYSTFM